MASHRSVLYCVRRNRTPKDCKNAMSIPRLNRRSALTLLALAFIPFSAPRPAIAAAASGGTDCPAAFRPFSTDTPLLDLLLNSAAKEIVDRDLPGFLAGLPRFLTGATPPTLADVLTIKVIASEFVPVPKSTLDKLDKELAAVPLTREAALVRCARYDETPPVLPEIPTHPAILVFSKSNGFRDDPSVNAGAAALKAMGERRHWSTVFSDNAAVFNAADLKRFDAVVWNNVSGDVLTVPQRRDFKAYIENGGGFAGFHGSGGDPYYDWDWYADTLIGARFLNHPMAPQFQAAKLHVDDARDPIVRNLPAEWTMTDEWYSFKTDPRAKGAHILVTLDETTYKPMSRNMDIHMGDHPIVWTQCVGNGRSFYSAIGHRPEGYSEPNTNKLLEQGVAWAAGLGPGHCSAGRETESQ
jgi:type 1 glutamine amidotransferase